MMVRYYWMVLAALMLVLGSAESVIWMSATSSLAMPSGSSLADAESTCTESTPCAPSSTAISESCEVRYLPGDYSTLPSSTLDFPRCAPILNVTFIAGGYYAFHALEMDGYASLYFGTADPSQVALAHNLNPAGLSLFAGLPSSLTNTFPDAKVRNVFPATTHAVFVDVLVFYPPSTTIAKIVFDRVRTQFVSPTTIKSCAFMATVVKSIGSITIIDSLIAGATQLNYFNLDITYDSSTVVTSINSDWLAYHAPIVPSNGYPLNFYNSSLRQLVGSAYEMFYYLAVAPITFDHCYLYNSHRFTTSMAFLSSSIFDSSPIVPPWVRIENSTFENCVLSFDSSVSVFYAPGSSFISGTSLSFASSVIITAQTFNDAIIDGSQVLSFNNSISLLNSQVTSASAQIKNGGFIQGCNLTVVIPTPGNPALDVGPLPVSFFGSTITASSASSTVAFENAHFQGLTLNGGAAVTMAGAMTLESTHLFPSQLTINGGSVSGTDSSVLSYGSVIITSASVTLDSIQSFQLTTISGGSSLTLESSSLLASSTISDSTITSSSALELYGTVTSSTVIADSIYIQVATIFSGSQVRVSSDSLFWSSSFLASTNITSSARLDLTSAVINNSSISVSASSGSTVLLPSSRIWKSNVRSSLTLDLTGATIDTSTITTTSTSNAVSGLTSSKVSGSNITSHSSIDATGSSMNDTSLSIGSASSASGQRFDCGSCVMRNCSLMTMVPTYATSLKYYGGTMDLGASIEAIGGSIGVGLLRLSSPSGGARTNVSVDMVTVKSNSYGNGSLVANGMVILDSSSNVVVERIALSANTRLSIHTMDILRSITGHGATSTLEPLINTSSSNLTSLSWTLHSIEITNVIMNVSAMTSLNYTHDSPTGISNSNGGTIVTSNSTLFLVDWAIVSSNGTSTAPRVGESYTMMTRGPSNINAKGRSEPFEFYRESADSKIKFRLPPCALPAPTSSSFTCANGKWISDSTVNTTILALPRNAGNVTIIGNLSATTVTFDGLGTALVVSGCNNEIQAVQVTLGEADLDLLERSGNKKSVTLASFGDGTNSSCETPVGSLSLVAGTSKASCRRVSAVKDSHSKSDLVAIFTLDSSRCNIWWIILASVLGGVVVIVVIIILIVKFVPSCTRTLRPYKNTDGVFRT